MKNKKMYTKLLLILLVTDYAIFQIPVFVSRLIESPSFYWLYSIFNPYTLDVLVMNPYNYNSILFLTYLLILINLIIINIYINKLLNKYKVENEIIEFKKKEFIACLAHDLRTPLTSIIGYLELLNDIEKLPLKERKKYLNITLEKSYYLEKLITELFEISKYDLGEVKINRIKLDLNIMLNQIIDDFYPVLNNKNKKIVYENKNSVVYYGDSNLLYRVFSNIIKNALCYGTNDSINIELMTKKNKVIITISNECNLILKEELSKIFDKFYRIDSSRNSELGGSGLGLSIAKEIVELHGGTIKAFLKDNIISFVVTLIIDN